MALAVSRAGVRRVCTHVEHTTPFAALSTTWPSLFIALVCGMFAQKAECSTSICCFVVHTAAAASCGGAILESKECDEILKVLQRCAAEMWSPFKGLTT